MIGKFHLSYSCSFTNRH